ncbi:MAG: Virulence protein [Candidatus Accumulibacter sp. SK-11]|nr:MAG: Virulence protein [Candidatus Accumulibacter sp. SK-11]
MAEAPSGEVLLYEAPDGGVRVEVKLDRDTVWLTQQQMADLFGRERSVVTKHIRNTFQEGELDPAATCAKFAQVRTEGARTVSREVDHFNLDVVISVGYRVKSLRGTQFRLWATRTLRDHLVQGYTLNRQRFEHNARELEAALALVRKAAAGEALSTDQGRGLVDVIARYTQTFLLLQRYDEGLLVEPQGIVGGLLPPALEARAAIVRLKRDLLARGEATELFGREREDGLAALLGNLDQSVFGEPAYPTVETKAAHLLYFVIKNRPFSDGNKRIGSFLFVEFLHRNGRLIRNGEAVINDVGLAALALLVA